MLQSQRLKVIEDTMSRVGSLANVGAYRAIYGVLGLIERQLNLPINHDLNIDDIIGEQSIQELKQIDFTADDIAIVDKKRPACRELIERKMIIILSTNRNVADAVANFKLAHKSFEYNHDARLSNRQYVGPLNTTDVDEILQANILNVDLDWFFLGENMQSLDNVMLWTSMSPETAFRYLDTLGIQEKRNLRNRFNEAIKAIRYDFDNLIKQDIHPREILADYERKAAGQEFLLAHEPNLLKAMLTPKLLSYMLTDFFKSDLSSGYLRYWIEGYTNTFTRTVITQPLAKAKKLLENFSDWSAMRFTRSPEHVAPPIEPLAIPELHQPSYDTLQYAIASTFLGDVHTIDLDKLASSEWNTYDLMQICNEDPYLVNRLNGTLTRENATSIFTDSFKAELHSEILTQAVTQLAYIEVNAYKKDAYFAPLDQGVNMTKAFGNWIQCYITANCTTQILSSLWKPVEVMKTALPATAANVTEAIVWPITAAPARANDGMNMRDFIVPAAALTGLGLLYASTRFFKKRTTYLPVATSEPQSQSVSHSRI